MLKILFRICGNFSSRNIAHNCKPIGRVWVWVCPKSSTTIIYTYKIERLFSFKYKTHIADKANELAVD